MSNPTFFNLHSAVFQVQKIAPKLIQELVALEQKLYNLNGSGTRLEKIVVLKTEMPFSDSLESFNPADFAELLTFFCKLDFITEAQSLQISEQSNSLSFFKRYVKKSDVSGMAATFLSAAFGSALFSEFDYTDKTNERAQDFMNNYGNLPVYEVADVTRRNQLIQKVVQTCVKKLNWSKNQPFVKGFLTETLSDASNSPLVIHFWMAEKAIIAVKAYSEV
ncbi:MAG: hypothetical protein RLZZ628_450 [Bacteroidota bacterium]|jgi:hypothetical protein